MLLSEVWRWTDDAALVREPARSRRCARSNGSTATATSTATVSSSTSAAPSKGSTNQSWKDSGDLAEVRRRARLPRPPIAPVEVQGYVYDAKLRVAELARDVWRDRELAERLEREAAELQRRFDDAFWVEERGGYYALALDADKRPVDSLCSNIGHLLWSGIVPPERVDAVVDQLMGEELWSGWGVRTMSSGGRRLQPARVPQRNRLAARQLADRLGARAVRALAGGAPNRPADAERRRRTSTTSCPRSSPASRAAETPFPIAVSDVAAGRRPGPPARPCSCSSCCSGWSPTGRVTCSSSSAPEGIPSLGGSLRLSGVRAFGKSGTSVSRTAP